MRLRHKKNAEAEILNHPIIINCNYERFHNSNDTTFELRDKEIHANNLCDPHAIFNNNNPIHIELGMGKGRFITELAIKNPNINYIGIEKSATIVLKAVDRLKSFDSQINHSNSIFSEMSFDYGIPNLRFMCTNVESLLTIFPLHIVDKIYLNFSDPWPKKRHESRRLMHLNFLKIYEKLLKPNGSIEFKTDNVDLFDFAILEVKKSNFSISSFTYDLHNDNILNKDNIMTEYEEKFSRLGNKICKLVAHIS